MESLEDLERKLRDRLDAIGPEAASHPPARPHAPRPRARPKDRRVLWRSQDPDVREAPDRPRGVTSRSCRRAGRASGAGAARRVLNATRCVGSKTASVGYAVRSWGNLSTMVYPPRVSLACPHDPRRPTAEGAGDASPGISHPGEDEPRDRQGAPPRREDGDVLYDLDLPEARRIEPNRSRHRRYGHLSDVAGPSARDSTSGLSVGAPCHPSHRLRRWTQRPRTWIFECKLCRARFTYRSYCWPCCANACSASFELDGQWLKELTSGPITPAGGQFHGVRLSDWASSLAGHFVTSAYSYLRDGRGSNAEGTASRELLGAADRRDAGSDRVRLASTSRRARRLHLDLGPRSLQAVRHRP